MTLEPYRIYRDADRSVTILEASSTEEAARCFGLRHGFDAAPQMVEETPGGPMVPSRYRWVLVTDGKAVGEISVMAVRIHSMICGVLPQYTIDADGGSGESWTLPQIIQANVPDTFSEEDLERIRAMSIGDQKTFGGGAWAAWTLTRVS